MNSQDPIVRLEYLTPFDDRCKAGFVKTPDDIVDKLRPVLGTNATTSVLDTVNKQAETWNVGGVIKFELRTTTILDIRMSNEVAKTTTVQYDSKVFDSAKIETIIKVLASLEDKPSEQSLKTALTLARRTNENTASN